MWDSGYQQYWLSVTAGYRCISLKTSNDIIARNGRERFMFELKCIERSFPKEMSPLDLAS